MNALVVIRYSIAALFVCFAVRERYSEQCEARTNSERSERTNNE